MKMQLNAMAFLLPAALMFAATAGAQSVSPSVNAVNVNASVDDNLPTGTYTYNQLLIFNASPDQISAIISQVSTPNDGSFDFDFPGFSSAGLTQNDQTIFTSPAQAPVAFTLQSYGANAGDAPVGTQVDLNPIDVTASFNALAAAGILGPGPFPALADGFPTSSTSTFNLTVPNATAAENVTDWEVDAGPAPEPGALGLIAPILLALPRRRGAE